MNLKVKIMLQAEWVKCRQDQLKEKSQKWCQKIKSYFEKVKLMLPGLERFQQPCISAIKNFKKLSCLPYYLMEFNWNDLFV